MKNYLGKITSVGCTQNNGLGSVKPVNAEFRSKWQAEKAAAKEAQKQRRDQELDDRRAQTAALMALAMGVVSRLESGEREKE